MICLTRSSRFFPETLCSSVGIASPEVSNTLTSEVRNVSSRSFRHLTLLVAATIGCTASTTYTNDNSNPADGWPTYGRDAGGARYSPLNEINKSNVSGLHVVWTYRTGDISNGSQYPRKSTF